MVFFCKKGIEKHGFCVRKQHCYIYNKINLKYFMIFTVLIKSICIFVSDNNNKI